MYPLVTKITPPEERNYPGEWCKRCNRAVTVGFGVPDAVWETVVKDRYDVLCLLCFDELSEETEIEWEDVVELFPTSRASWKRWLKEHE